VQRALLAADIARLETDKARAGHLPTVDAVASLGSSHAKGAGAQLPGTSTGATLGVQLNLPLFSGYSVQNRIKETLVLEDKARNDLDAARRAVAQATRVAFYGVQSGQAQAKALEAAESSSKLALEATQLGYKVGVRVNLDVLNSQTQLNQTQRDLSKARYDVLLATLRLRQAAGTLQPPDIGTLNALLTK
jgi:outer membrane protein